MLGSSFIKRSIGLLHCEEHANPSKLPTSYLPTMTTPNQQPYDDIRLLLTSSRLFLCGHKNWFCRHTSREHSLHQWRSARVR
eukprot:4559829-Amphidinium_carterae.2